MDDFKSNVLNGVSPFREPASPFENEIEFPKSTSEWDSCMIDKLGIHCKEENILTIITEMWCLFDLNEQDFNQISNVIDDCCLGCLNMDPIEDTDATFVTPFDEFYTRKWCPGFNDIQTLLKLGDLKSLFKKFEMRAEELAFTLGYIIADLKKDAGVSELQYQVIFEKVLHLFDIKTVSRPLLGTEKEVVLGKTMSSEPHIICCRTDPTLQRLILCVCQVNKGSSRAENGTSHQNKRPKLSSSQSPGYTINKFAQHIGDLFIHLNKSVTTRGVLGMTVEKTSVRITYLQVQSQTMVKIRRACRQGPVNLQEEERPQFVFSQSFDYLKRKDREVLFKALLLIKLMLVKYEKGQM